MKNLTKFLGRLSVRSEAVSGGAVPDDELQVDVTVSTGDVDTYFSVMSESSLRNYAVDAAAGVPFMLDHSSDTSRQLGRSISGSYSDSDNEVSAVLSMLRDSESTPPVMQVNEYIRRMERGFYTDVSVGFRGGDEVCQICNKGIWEYRDDNPCPHIPGTVYDGTRCTYEVRDAHLREISLVAHGSNPNAKVLDTREWSEDLRSVKPPGEGSSYNQQGSQKDESLLERDGRKYRDGLIAEAVRMGIRAIDDFDEEVWKGRLSEMDADFISSQAEMWKAIGDARWGPGGRVTGDVFRDDSGDAVILPAYLFRY